MSITNRARWLSNRAVRLKAFDTSATPFPFRCSLAPRGANGLAPRRSNGLAPRRSNGGSGVVRRSNSYDVEKVDRIGGP